MRIESVRIKNFRSFKDETISFDGYTCLVGPNGSGKSNVLTALNAFFRQKEDQQTNLITLSEEDFHKRDKNSPIEITVTFCDLSDQAKINLAHYVRQERLVVTLEASWDPESKKIEVRQYGQRMAMPDFARFFDAVKSGARVSELREIYVQFQETHEELPNQTTRNNMEASLKEYEESHPDLCELIKSTDQFYGVGGTSHLEPHIHWVYVPAVKDAAKEQKEERNTALGKLLQIAVKSRINFDEEMDELRTRVHDLYEGILVKHKPTLGELSKNLNAKVKIWAHALASLDLNWNNDTGTVRIEDPTAFILAGEGGQNGFAGEIARFGHGMQRSYLMALLQELSEMEKRDDANLILGFEEPELYQHPSQTRHIASVIRKLTDGGSQIITTTHSPYLITGKNFEDVRLVTKNNENYESSSKRVTYREIADSFEMFTGVGMPDPSEAMAKIHQYFQSDHNEIFFARLAVLVEGTEDVAYIKTYLELMEKYNDFHSAGGDLIPVHGKGQMLKPVIVAQRMQIPVYIVFDSDAVKCPAGHDNHEQHKKDNSALLRSVGQDTSLAMQQRTVSAGGITMWKSNIADVVKEEVDDFSEYSARSTALYSSKNKKNSLHIANTLVLAWQEGKRSPSLIKLCENILDPSKYFTAK